MRNPIAADRFYAGEPVKLQEQVKGFLLNLEDEKAKVSIVPHGSYQYCGKCLGEIYSRFVGDVDTIIILGSCHSCDDSKIFFSFENFLTPLGKVEIDTDLAESLFKNSILRKIKVADDSEIHEHEHCIEVQLPFIQTVFGTNDKKIKIVPILVGPINYEECLEFSIVLTEEILKSGKKIKIVVSSDFSHYGELYDFIPFDEDIRENLFELDKKSIQLVLNLDSKRFFDYAINNTSICGVEAITIGIETAKGIGCQTARKVCYFTSGDITKDYTNSVNYAGILVR